MFTTYVIYTYKCGELEWSGPDFLHAVVGYNLRNVGFMNEPLSGTPGILTIACENRPISNFVNIAYRFQANPGKIFYIIIILLYDRCIYTMSCYFVYGMYIEYVQESDIGIRRYNAFTMHL